MDPINMNNSDRESIFSLLFQELFKKTDGEVTVPDSRPDSLCRKEKHRKVNIRRKEED